MVPWGAVGGLLLASWGPLGCFGCRLGAPWCFTVDFWYPSGVVWGALGVSWGPLGAPRWSFGRIVGGFLASLVWPGAFFGGPRGYSRILVALPRAGQKPSSKKRAVETQAGHTHTHATSFTKPRFPFHDSQVLLAFPRAGQKPSRIKTRGKSSRNANGTHPHACNILYKTALPVP